MLAKLETQEQLHARIAREAAETRARIDAIQSELVEHMAKSRSLIAEARELMAHMDEFASRLKSPLIDDLQSRRDQLRVPA